MDMKNTTRNILIGFALAVGVLALLAAVPSQTDFDGTYFKTNTLPISLVGNLVNWQQRATNTFSSHWVDSGTSDSTLAGTASADGATLTNTFNIGTTSSVHWDRTNSQLRLGDSTVGLFFNGQGPLQVRRQGADATARIVSAADASTSYLALDHVRGTFAAPTAVKSGDTLGNVVGVGWDGVAATMSHGASTRYEVSQDWAAGAHGTTVGLWATKNGTTTEERLFQVGASISGVNYASVATFGYEAGANTTGLAFVNQSNNAGTGIGMNFIPNANLSYPFGRIDVARPTTDIGAVMTFSVINTAGPYGLLPAMTIFTNRNVGIGTNAPSEKLEVLGNIKASGQVIAPSFQEVMGVISHAGTSTLDFSPGANANKLVLTGAVTIAFSNLETNRYYHLMVANAQATNCSYVLPAVTFMGYYPTNIVAGKTAEWFFKVDPQTNSIVYAKYVEQQ